MLTERATWAIWKFNIELALSSDPNGFDLIKGVYKEPVPPKAPGAKAESADVAAYNLEYDKYQVKLREYRKTVSLCTSTISSSIDEDIMSMLRDIQQPTTNKLWDR